MKKIAVLMATYNGEQFVSEQIESILQQKDVEVTLIISDDGSTDRTRDIVHNFINKNDNVTLCNESRIGGPAKNFYNLIRQVNACEYDFLALSDQDDVWSSHRLSRAIDQLTTHQADAYSSNVLVVDDHLKIKTVLKKSGFQKKYDFLFEPPGPGCSFVFSRSLFEFIQSKIVERVFNFAYHDWFIYALARHHEHRWLIDDQPNIFYRQHAYNFMGANIGLRAKIKRIKRILKGDYKKELVQLHELIYLGQHELNARRICFFLTNVYHTRRSMTHYLLNIPIMLLFLIQKK